MDPIRFPGESNEYRTARNALLDAERELRRQIEKVAEQRRALPLGGAIPVDYEFDEAGKSVRLSDLFGDKDTLLLYNFMFAGSPCPMCSAWLDGLDGDARHIQQRVAMAVVGFAPYAKLDEHRKARGWKNLRLLSSGGTTYNRDYHGQEDDGEQESMMNVFVKSSRSDRGDGTVHHFYATELKDSDAGQNSRHLDLMWPLWGAFDLTPGGRGGSWYPKLSY